MIVGFSRMILVNPSWFSAIILSIMASRALKEVDFNQNPKVNLWHRGKSSWSLSWFSETILAKKFEKAEEDKLFSKKWIILSASI